MGLELQTAKRLRTTRRQWLKKLTQKKEVMKRHEPGTSWHTRAKLDAESYELKIHRLEQELRRRGEPLE